MIKYSNKVILNLTQKQIDQISSENWKEGKVVASTQIAELQTLKLQKTLLLDSLLFCSTNIHFFAEGFFTFIF